MPVGVLEPAVRQEE
jgi:hypothetical protein